MSHRAGNEQGPHGSGSPAPGGDQGDQTSWLPGNWAAAWDDEPGWWRDAPEARPAGTGRPPAGAPAAAGQPGAAFPSAAAGQPGPRGSEARTQPAHRRPAGPPRSRRRLVAVTGSTAAVVIAVAAGLILTGVISPARPPVPGFHPTTTRPALAARQTAAAFLSAWQRGQTGTAAGYTDDSAAAAAALTAYRDGLHLRGLHLAAKSATRKGKVTFTVKATVSLAGSKPVTASWSYDSHLTAYERRGGWWVRWDPALVAPNLTAAEKVVTQPVLPGVGQVTDGAGNDLSDAGDPGLANIAAQLKTRAPAGKGTPGVEVVLSGAHGLLGSTADVLRQPVNVGMLRTTVDPRVEAAAQSAVQAHPGSSMVVLQPETGAILGIANNDGANDFALTAQVAPGSTDKIISSTALFTSGLVASPGTGVECPPTLVINGNTFKNDQGESEPAGTPFMTDFAASCNNAFARWYSRLGASTLAQTAEKYYGLNQVWDIGLGTGGRYYTIPATAYNGELAQELFGEGQLEASPLAMASVAATVDTGTFRQPIVLPGQAQLHATPLPAGVDQDLQQMMQAVTAPGGTAAGVFDGVGSQVYAKTGTADVDSQGKPNSWLVAYDPTLDVAAGCLVQNAGYGAAVAGPEVASLLQALAQQ